MEAVISVLLYTIVLATAFPAGLLLRNLCDDELVKDRKYFKIMLALFILAIILFLIFYPRISFILTLAYLVGVIIVLLRK